MNDRSIPAPGDAIGHVIDLYVMDENGDVWLARSMQEWADNQRVTRRVKTTELPDGEGVSTVFVGINQGVYPGLPLLFETAVRRAGHWEPAGRHASRAEALIEHDRLVAEMKDIP